MKKVLVMIVGILSMVGIAFAGDVKTESKVIKAPVQKQLSTVKKAKPTKKVKKTETKVETPKAEIKK